MRPKALPAVSLIGPGKVGSALALALAENGFSFSSIVGRGGRSVVAVARAVGCKKVANRVEDVAPGSEFILIATPDSAVREVASELARVRKLSFRKLFVAHTSGVLDSGALEPLRKKGAQTASIHPIQTFPDRRSMKRLRASLRGIPFGIEGGGGALESARRIVERIGGKPVVIPSGSKALYHACCVFASGYLAVILNAIIELSAELKLAPPWTEVFGPLMTAAMENALGESPAASITGPILRRDFETVELHLRALARRAPRLLPLYAVAGAETARIAARAGRIDRQVERDVVALFRAFIRTASFTEPKKDKK